VTSANWTACADYDYSQFFEVTAGRNWVNASFDFSVGDRDNCALLILPGEGSIEYNAGGYPTWLIYNEPAPATGPEITSFDLNAASGTLRVRGFFTQASENPGQSQALFVYREDELSGLQPLDFPAGNPVFATTTGPFDLTFSGAGFTSITGPDFGQFSYQATTTFTARIEQWTDSVPTTLVSTSTQAFGTTTQVIVGENIGFGNTVGTSTLPDATNFLSFLNVPQLLATKVPFGYFFQARNAITRGVTSTSSEPFPGLTITYMTANGGTTSQDMFSRATIDTYYPEATRNLLRQVMVAILYTTFAYALYRIGKSQHIFK